ncbi:MAG: hypothetical protein F4X32_07940 [Candidatus Dadabacteria bacterium]|nr:hypothetical protein [Candidatus Dadabacteria bacterium]
MVSLVTTESTVRMLIERLNWPVRLARWRTAREFGLLLSSTDYSKLATEVYLDWLSKRQFESEIASALAVLFCTPENSLPSFQTVAGHIARPSILADIMLEAVYGVGKTTRGWDDAHSAEVPRLFEPETYFLNHKSVYVPPIFGNEFEKLEKQTGFPFIRQWGFEWHQLMESTKAPYSNHPYYFIEPSLSRSGIFGQFSQRQCDVYQSAYLRTLACAVNCWDIPEDLATEVALHALPLNRGLGKLNVAERPVWLSDIPEKCVNAEESLEPLVRNLIKPGLEQKNMRPVVIKTPISADIAEFSNVSICAILASTDFVYREHCSLDGGLILPLPDGVTIKGMLGKRNISDFTSSGIAGVAAPLCLDLFSLPTGLWLVDYLRLGISLPAPYVFENDVEVACRSNCIEIISGGKEVASWKVWHDRWTPLHAKDGATRCGMLTELREDEINKAQDRHGMALGWLVELNVWKQKEEHEPFELNRRREFFLDQA